MLFSSFNKPFDLGSNPDQIYDGYEYKQQYHQTKTGIRLVESKQQIVGAGNEIDYRKLCCADCDRSEGIQFYPL